MNLKKLSLALCWLFTPSLFAAEEQKQHRYTERDAISFKATTESAFDRSGHKVTHTFSHDGSIMANHNGTLGHVTVARLSPDGRLETLCTTDHDAAVNFMSGESEVNLDSSVELQLEER